MILPWDLDAFPCSRVNQKSEGKGFILITWVASKWGTQRSIRSKTLTLQEFSWSPRNSHEVPGTLMKSQELSWSHRNSHEVTGTLRKSRELSGSPRSPSDLTGTPRDSHEPLATFESRHFRVLGGLIWECFASPVLASAHQQADILVPSSKNSKTRGQLFVAFVTRFIRRHSNVQCLQERSGVRIPLGIRKRGNASTNKQMLLRQQEGDSKSEQPLYNQVLI